MSVERKTSDNTQYPQGLNPHFNFNSLIYHYVIMKRTKTFHIRENYEKWTKIGGFPPFLAACHFFCFLLQ
jgi:hypothetical protein